MEFSCRKNMCILKKFSSHFHFFTFTSSWNFNHFLRLRFFFDELITFFNTFVDSQNYVVVKQRTKKHFKINEIMKIYFRCDRENKSKNIKHDYKRIHVSNRLIECPFFCFALNKVNVS